MNKAFLLFAFFSTCAIAEAGAPRNNIENQIRLCDSNENIINKLNLEKKSISNIEIQNKKFKVYYAETHDRDYSNLKWSIRFREKDSKVEITIKKKMNSTDEISKYSNAICEYDLHGKVKDYSCKINSEIPSSEFKKVLDNNKNWTKLLSQEQYDFLKENNAVFENASIYGTLHASRFQWTDKNFGPVTLDLVHLSHNAATTYNEVSIRYPVGSSINISNTFETYIANSGVIVCANQADWSVDKLDVLEILN